ncbi:cyclic nucleotide-binding domain-containing protein [Marinospirillum sp. MEB164]|uniref:Cyclic nucleotide-binding domain-containing protein n=1 Tax=Marinospirillum alkalitolerans TaxID=3123374 RepID=A0ABW8Q057_9GAMM
MKQIATLRHKMIQLLDRVAFFDGFDANEKLLLVEGKGMLVIAEPGETIIQQDTLDTTLYVPLSGLLEVRRRNEAGEQVALAQLHAGEIIGEMGFLKEMPRTSSVVVLEQSILFRCSRQALKNLSPITREKLKDQLIDKLIQRIQEQNLKLSENQLVSPQPQTS